MLVGAVCQWHTFSTDRSGAETLRELPCSGAILQLLCEERFSFLPDFLLEEMKVRMVCALDGKKRHIAACLLQFVMEQFALSKGHRMVVLPVDDQEGRLLGVNVTQIRLIVLLIATLAASSVISMTGLISFISLLAPHGARLLFKNNRLSTMLFSGLLGGCLLTLGDIFARSIASTELPVSIFTSLLGAPFLIYLCIMRKPLQ